jgi:Mg-chelatase subunit ChlD
VGSLSFLTPAAALVALAGIVPALVHLRRERRARAVRAVLGLAEPPPGPRRLLLAALVSIPLLLGLAAAQPVVDRARAVGERADAETFFVVDTSRSMLASAAPREPTRVERARAAAVRLRAAIPQVRAGVASLTDRTLPHLFPTVDARTFAATLRLSLGIERPPPAVYSTVATELGSLADVARRRFFAPEARHRLLVVLTDGETEPPAPVLATALRRQRVEVVFVHVRRDGESVYVTSARDPAYRTDPASRERLEQLAGSLGGRVFGEDELDAAAAHARDRLGDGPIRPRPQRDLFALMPYVTLAAAFPLALALRRRNF